MCRMTGLNNPVDYIGTRKTQAALIGKHHLMDVTSQRTKLMGKAKCCSVGNTTRTCLNIRYVTWCEGVYIHQWLTTLTMVHVYLVLERSAFEPSWRWTTKSLPTPSSTPGAFKNRVLPPLRLCSAAKTQFMYCHNLGVLSTGSLHFAETHSVLLYNSTHLLQIRTVAGSKNLQNASGARFTHPSYHVKFRRKLSQLLFILFLMLFYLPTGSLSSFTSQYSAFNDNQLVHVDLPSSPMNHYEYHSAVQYFPDIAQFKPSIPHLPCRYRFRTDVETSALLAEDVIVGVPLETFRRRYGPMYNISVSVKHVLKETATSLFPVQEDYLLRVGQFSIYPDLGRCQIDVRLHTPYIFFIRKPDWTGFCQVSQLPVAYSKEAVKRIQRIIRLGPYPLQMRPLYHADQLEADENNDVLLTCRVRGRPTPLISWYHNDTEIKTPWRPGSRYGIIQQTQNLSKLQLAKLQLSDAGNYTCLAENLNGHIRKSVQIVVRPMSTTPAPTTTSTTTEPPMKFHPCHDYCYRGHCYIIDNKPYCSCITSYRGTQCDIPIPSTAEHLDKDGHGGGNREELHSCKTGCESNLARVLLISTIGALFILLVILLVCFIFQVCERRKKASKLCPASRVHQRVNTQVLSNSTTIPRIPQYDTPNRFGTIKLVKNPLDYQMFLSPSFIANGRNGEPRISLRNSFSQRFEQRAGDPLVDQEALSNGGIGGRRSSFQKCLFRTFSAPASLNTISRVTRCTTAGSLKATRLISQSMFSFCQEGDVPAKLHEYPSKTNSLGPDQDIDSFCIHDPRRLLQLGPVQCCSPLNCISDNANCPLRLSPSLLQKPDNQFVQYPARDATGPCSTFAYQNPCFGRDSSYLFFNSNPMNHNMFYFLNDSASATSKCTTFRRSFVQDPHDQNLDINSPHMTHSRPVKNSPRIIL